MKWKKKWIAATAILLFINITSWSQTSQYSTYQKPNKKMQTATVERNQTIVRAIFEQALNDRKPELLKNYIADEFVGARGTKGAEGFLEPVKPLLAAFPDIRWHVEEIMSDGNKVALRWKWTGTNKANFVTLEPTGKTMFNEGQAFFELKDGKVIVAHVLTDRLSFLQQMDVVPTDINQLYMMQKKGH